jgi:tetratricopeptide (TPR) repeat protein
MSVGGKNFNRSFASVSPVFVALAITLALLCVGTTAPAFAAGTASVKRQAAEAQFARAEEQRAILNSKPANQRTLAEYKQVVTSYRRVYLITPHAVEVPEALVAVAELYTEMGDRFGRSYYQSAVDSYQFLVHEYPKSRYCQDSALHLAHLQKEELGDTALATKSYEDFLKKYPRSQHRREVEEALAELALLRNSDAAAPAVESASPPERVEELPKTAVGKVDKKALRGEILSLLLRHSPLAAPSRTNCPGPSLCTTRALGFLRTWTAGVLSSAKFLIT